MNDLADEPLNNRLARVLAAKIENLEQEDRKKLQHAARAGKIIIRSTFELDAPEKRKLTTILHEICGKDADVAYQVDADCPLGIEARAGNIRLAWGIDNYLEELQSRVLSLVEEKTREQRKSNDNGSTDKTGETEEENDDEEPS
jgi:F-type H+-transporting ATPase subunit b